MTTTGLDDPADPHAGLKEPGRAWLVPVTRGRSYAPIEAALAARASALAGARASAAWEDVRRQVEELLAPQKGAFQP